MSRKKLHSFPCFGVWIKAAVYIGGLFCKSCAISGVFRFAKTMKFLNKGGIRYISRVFPGHFSCVWSSQ